MLCQDLSHPKGFSPLEYKVYSSYPSRGGCSRGEQHYRKLKPKLFLAEAELCLSFRKIRSQRDVFNMDQIPGKATVQQVSTATAKMRFVTAVGGRLTLGTMSGSEKLIINKETSP